jgi:hemolysin activation/secretion protein
VRGYSEGLLTGRSGYLASAELRRRLYTPAEGSGGPHVTGLAFIDHGGAFPFRPEPLSDITKADFLSSAGLGLVAEWGPRVQARLTLGWPLRNESAEAERKRTRLHASITVNWP